MTLCFATNNRNKLNEVQRLLGTRITVVTLNDVGCDEELLEDQNTIEGNSLQKAKYIAHQYHLPTFADDTGLVVEALQGEPGVRSARYAGPQRRDEDNIALLLKNLEGVINRKAHFKTIVTLVDGAQVHQFEGVVNGTILPERRGTGGFGYDPVFLPDGHSRTFAEMSGQEKNEISHRAAAIKKLVDFLSLKGPVTSGHE
jgi:XTP/dITP diphosphohydrolase